MIATNVITIENPTIKNSSLLRNLNIESFFHTLLLECLLSTGELD